MFTLVGMRKRHRREDLERLLAQRADERLTFRELSERSGVPIPTLNYWAVKFRREQVPEPPKLVPVEITNEQRPGELIVELAAGVRLRVEAGFDPDRLAALLASLATRC